MNEKKTSLGLILVSLIFFVMFLYLDTLFLDAREHMMTTYQSDRFLRVYLYEALLSVILIFAHFLAAHVCRTLFVLWGAVMSLLMAGGTVWLFMHFTFEVLLVLTMIHISAWIFGWISRCRGEQQS